MVQFLDNNKYHPLQKTFKQQERIWSNANHSFAESMGYIKFEGM